jgi:hypothetical protein
MKKIITFALALLLGTTTTFALDNNRYDHDTPISYDELPHEAKNFISKNFAKEQVSHVTVDKDIISDEYKVVFTSGTKLEFDGNGDWKELDCRYSAVPNNLVPEKIAKYIKTNYPNSKITELKREHSNWEAKITGGLELTFNSNFKLVDIDD